MKRPQHGFTLIELLVVITIIGMLVGLLLPAVQIAREMGRRASCTNNLKNLSLACRAHSEKLNFFPSGGWGSNWVGDPNYSIGSDQPGGWIYQLMPYMDQDELHDLGKGASSSTATANSATRVSTFLPILYCPTRRAPLALPIASNNTGGTGVSTAGRTDYAMNGGSNLPSLTTSWTPFPHYPGPSAGTTMQGGAAYAWPALSTGHPLTDFNGIAAIHSKVTEAMIPDNKETTYLICEKYLSPENYVTGVDSTPTQNDSGDTYSAMSGDDTSLIRWGSNSSSQPLLPAMDRSANNNPPPSPSLIFGSTHGAGWIASFCDGHAQLIGWGINGALHQSMCTRNGHEVVDASQIPH